MSQPDSGRGWRRWLIAALVLAAAAGLVAGAVYLAAQLGLAASRPQAYPYLWEPTPGPRVAPPLTSFAPVDPAIIQSLALNQGRYDVIPLVVMDEVMPVGAYVPLEGSAQFQLTTPTLGRWSCRCPTEPLIPPATDVGIIPTETPVLSPVGRPRAATAWREQLRAAGHANRRNPDPALSYWHSGWTSVAGRDAGYRHAQRRSYLRRVEHGRIR
jgi:hypothetical protein